MTSAIHKLSRKKRCIVLFYGKYVFTANTVDVNPSKHNEQGVQKLSSLDAWLKEVITLGKFACTEKYLFNFSVCHQMEILLSD